jgi:hypothetical protein
LNLKGTPEVVMALQKMNLSQKNWESIAEQSGLDMTQLDQEAVFMACQRLRHLLERLDKIADTETEVAGVFQSQDYEI